MALAFARSYTVSNIATAFEDMLHVTLVQNNSETDVNGAPMGGTTITLLMSKDEARGYFPGDRVAITLGPETESAE